MLETTRSHGGTVTGGSARAGRGERAGRCRRGGCSLALQMREPGNVLVMPAVPIVGRTDV